MLDAGTILNVVQTIPTLASIVKLLSKDGKPLISMKHLVVKSDFVLRQLLDGQFQTFYEQVKAKRVYMQNNDVSSYLREIHRDHITREAYPSWDETPVSELRDANRDCFETSVSVEDLTRVSQKYDPLVTARVVRNLSDNRVAIDPKQFYRITYLQESCGDEISEMIEFRPLWLVLLWIENLSDAPVEIGHYKGKMYYPNVALDYRELSFGHGEEYSGTVPFRVLQREESILIPELILLAPLDAYLPEDEKEVHSDSYEGALEFLYAFTPMREADGFNLLGPSLHVERIELAGGTHQVHQFDIANTLTVSRLFEVGSCPHVIGYRDEKFYHIKDVLSSGPEIIDIRDFEYIVIAEIEEEITVLDEVAVGDESVQRPLLANKVLRKGGFIVVDNVSEHHVSLTLKGHYFSRHDSANKQDALVWKYQNLMRFLFQLTNKPCPRTWLSSRVGALAPSLQMSDSPPCAEHIRTLEKRYYG
jgi:hypothetical protein